MSLHIINDFIAIYSILEIAIYSMLNMINDVIMCSNVIHFPLFSFHNMSRATQKGPLV